jgi:hypothetical protein
LFTQANSINSTPITPNTYYIFENLVLPTGADATKIYYFSYVVLNESANSAKSPISSAFSWTPIAPAGPFVDISGFTSFSKSTGGSYTPAFTTLTAVTQNITSPTYAWTITGATPTTGSASTITITPDALATSVVAQLVVNGTNLTSPITRTVTMAIIQQGADAPKYATAYLYQWNTVTPTNPSGSSTYTWSSGASSSYTGGGGWSVTAPANPGTPLIRLYVASKQVTDVGTATTTSVSWTSGYSISDASQNGANGVQNATPTVYQWAVTIPSISGTSTYTWATGTFTPNPSGWSTGITTAPSSGYTLWAARVQLTDSATVTTSTINWTTASIVAAGYAGDSGTSGSSARICYAKSTSFSLSSTPTTYTTSGSSSFPPYNTWGGAETWQATPPTLSTNEALFQSDGIYNPSTGNTIWNVPYLSNLKVGNLAAISVNTGALTVQDSITVGSSGYIAGGQYGYNSGTGFFLGYSGGYKFSIGSYSNNMLWDGSSLQLNGASLIGGSISIGSGSAPGGSAFYVSTAGAVFVDNIFGGIGRFTNDNYTGISLQSFTTKAYEAIVGTVGATNSSAFAHGVRGQNQYNGTSGLIGVANGYDFYADGSGTNYGPFTGNHDILLPIDQTLTEGTLLVDVQCIARNGWSNAIFQVAASTQANQVGARGIFVGELRPLSSVQPPVFIDHWEEVDGRSVPVMTAQYETIKNDYWFGSMNALGEGQIQVCGENGNIPIDGLIVASNTTGIGMAQSDDVVRGYTVAKAREAITFSSSTDIQTVACIYISG